MTSEIFSEKLSPRDRIVATGMRLFNEGGPHTIGIDRIIAESGVAKRTFYHHFPSKTALLAEFFRRKDEVWFDRLERHTEDRTKPPLERLLALFDAMKEWYSEPDFLGCAFIRGLADFGADCGEPELVACVREHFERTGKILAELLQAVRPDDYAEFLPLFSTLLGGATVVAHATKDPAIADNLKAMARKILTASAPQSTPSSKEPSTKDASPIDPVSQ
ncbi:MAG TPA: TetR/AcrR family transcriptional regulator [Candidatus Methylacidiphilales bacterium]